MRKVILLLLFACTVLQAQEGGYTLPNSVAQGDTIRFYISTAANPFNLTIYRFGWSSPTLLTASGLTGAVQPVPDSAYWYGCNWNVTYSLVIPSNWKSGLYGADFPSSSGTQTIPFVVRQKIPGSTTKAAVVIMFNTMQAFNSYGGKSLYEYNSSNSVRSYKVSFARPYSSIGQIYYPIPLIQWMDRNSMPVECLTDYDLDANPSILNNYNMVAFVGNHEYWTMGERTNVDQFVANGGRVASFAADNCYFQVRFENNGQTMVCYKWPTLDPLNGINNSLVTYLFSASPVNDPESKLFGPNTGNGGYVNSGSLLPASQGYGDYGVTNASHWIYQGTGLKDADEFGFSEGLVGYETDGTPFWWNNGTPQVTGTDQTPLNFRILGVSPSASGNSGGAADGHATMGMYYSPAGGAVFSAATTNWIKGLSSDAVVQRITSNIFNKFLKGSFPPEITAWSPAIPVLHIVNNDTLYVSKRDTSLSITDSLPFTLAGSDPKGEPVQYSWILNGLQVGTGASFVFRGGSALQAGNTLTALAYNSHDTASLSWNVTVTAPAASPVLLSPANVATSIPLTQILLWNGVAGTLSYHLQVSTDSSFTTVTTKDTTLSDTSYTLHSLGYQTAYFWRVNATNNLGTGLWSGSWKFTTVQPPVYGPEGGYALPLSVAQGDTVFFRISTALNPFTLTINRWGATIQPVLSASGISGGLQPLPDSAFWYGCNWNVTYTLVIPSNWTSGMYMGEFIGSDNQPHEIPFVIRQKNPGSTSKLAVGIMLNTEEAFNSYGGKSLYEYNSSNNVRSYKVSFARAWGGIGELYWPQELMAWLEREGIPYECIDDQDLDASPSILNNYTVLALSGHHEYWSMPERSNVEQFIGSGGRMMYLGGNPCWWQVRFENSGQTMVCYKWPTLDPLNGVNNSLVTYNWSQAPVNDPENKLFGVSTLRGGYSNYSSYYLKADGYGDFGVTNAENWIYKGTGLKDGDEFGWNEGLVGYEADGALFQWINGVPVPTGTDQSPLNYRILGIAPTQALEGYTVPALERATMGYYYAPGGGAVFSASTINWNGGLGSDTIVQRITRNVLTHFLAGTYAPEIIAWSPSRGEYHSVNNDTLYVNRRDTTIFQSDSLLYSVTGSDPKGETLHYLWTLNGAPAGSGSSFLFHGISGILGVNTITAFVYNSHDTVSMAWNVTANSSPLPAAPALFSPSNGATGQPLASTLIWLKTAGATAYRLQASTDSTFTTVTTRDTTIADTSFIVGGLAYQSSYFWRVNASNISGPGPWSAIWKFSTSGPPVPVAPLLVLPPNGATGLPLALTLKWSPTTWASSYRVQVSTDSNFASFLMDSVRTDTTLPVSGLSYLTTYYWRVNATNGSGTSSWSVRFGFTTQPIQLPPAIILLAPANGSTGQQLVITYRWNKTPLAVSYRLQIGMDSTFGSGIVSDTTLADSSIALSGLAYNTKYYWHVTGSNASGPGAWSPTWNLTTKVSPPSTPILASPANAVTGQPLSLTLRWLTAAWAASYRVQVSTDSNFASFLMDSVRTDTTLPVSGLSYLTTYYWRVNATNGSGTSSWSVRFGFTAQPIQLPPAIILLAPANGSTGQQLVITYRWNKTPLAVSYRLQVGMDSTFGSGIVSDTTLADSSIALSGLAYNTKYYWHVTGSNASGPGAWSTTWNLTTKVSPPSTPILASPADAVTGQPLSLTLRWLTAAWAASYRVQFSTDSNFASLLKDSVRTDTTLPVSGLSYLAQYYWRVSASNGTGTSAWSARFGFTTQPIPLPPAITLLAPANGSTGQPLVITYRWNKTALASLYHLQIGTDSTFNSGIIKDTSLVDTSAALDGIAYNTKYFWHVSGANVSGPGAWSPGYSLTTRFPNFWVTAYYSGISQGYSNNGRLPSTKIDYTALTHIIHFSVVPQANASLDYTTNNIYSWNSSALISAAHAAGRKVLVSIGRTEANFVSAVKSHQATLVSNIVSFVKSRGYDGVDIDWNPLNAVDSVQYKPFIIALRTALNAISPRPLLTATVNLNPQIVAQLQGNFDQINLMNYDQAALAGGTTWHNSPIYDAGFKLKSGATAASLNSMAGTFTGKGISGSKLGAAISFYGDVWTGGSGISTGGVTAPRQTWTTAPAFSGQVPYYTIMSSYYQAAYYQWDPVAQATYLSIDLTGSKNDKFVSYDDEQTCRAKITYAKSQGFGGIAVWELGAGYRTGQAVPDNLLQAIKAAMGGSVVPFVTVHNAPTGSEQVVQADVPNQFVLMQNYPNPFNPVTSIRYGLPADATVSLVVYNILGQEVATLVQERQSAGYHEVMFNSTNLASGVYLYRIKTEQFSEVKRMVLIK